MDTTTVSSIMTSVGDVVTSGIDWMGQFLDQIVSNPVLLIFCVATPLVGLGVGLANRLLRG